MNRLASNRRLDLEELESRHLLTVGLFPSAVPLTFAAELTGVLDQAPTYYAFTITDPGRLTAQLSPATGHARLSLFSPAGEVLLQSEGQSASDHGGYLDLHLTAQTGPTTYYLAIDALAGSSGSYSLMANYAVTTELFRPLSVGTDPWASATGDFNGDRLPDLAVAGYISGTMSIYLGVGDGTFAPAQQYAIGLGANHMLAADLNGDGHADLVTANFDDNTVSVLLGKANGTFTPSVDHPAGDSPGAVTAGDFDHDGDLDLAVAAYGSSSVTILSNTGTGDFSLSAEFSVGLDPFGIVAGDFNGDSNLDLASANYGSGDVTVLLGNGDGHFSIEGHYPAGQQAYTLVASDLDQDGDLDLATANFESNDLTILLGSADGSFAAGQTLATGGRPSGITAADLNNDGRVDLIVANNHDGTLSLFLGHADGTFDPQRSLAGGSALTNVNAADFDQDGAVDLAFLDITSNTARIALGNADGTFQLPPAVVSASQLFQVVSADLDGDGRLDLATVDYTSMDGVLVFLGQQDGTFRYGGSYTVGSDGIALAAGDVNDDGIIDLVTANYSTDNVSVLLGNGDGSFAAPAFFTAASVPEALVMADLDRDGHRDVAVAASGSNQIAVLFGDGTGRFAEPVFCDVGSVPRSIAVADFDGDGQIDLVASNSSSDDVSVLFNAGNRTFETQLRLGSGHRPKGLATGDFDHDGDIDLVASNLADGSISVFLSEPGRGFASLLPAFFGGELFDVLAGDFDNDATLDLVALDRQSNAARLLHGLGDGTFEPADTIAVGTLPGGGALGDFNADGLLDLVTANLASSDLSVLLGQSDGHLRAVSAVFLGNAPAAIAAADFNNDGRLDVVTAAAGGALVALSQGYCIPNNTSVVIGGDSAGVVAADFNRDGRADLAVSDQRAGTVRVLLGIGDGTFEETPVVRVGRRPGVLALGDFDRNGHADLAVVDPASDAVFILLGTGGGTFATARQIALGDAPIALAVGDLNADGWLDLAVANSHSRDLWVLLGSASGSFSLALTLPLDAVGGSLVIGDFDNDGHADLAVTSQARDGVAVLLGNSAGAFSLPVWFAAGTAPVALAAGDFDHDGHLDLATAGSGALGVLLGRGDGTFHDRTSHNAGRYPLALLAADFDSDSHLDLVSANGLKESGTVLLGVGDGAFVSAKIASRAMRSTPLVGDLNGDGLPDVTVLAHNGNVLVRLATDDHGRFAPPVIINPASPVRDVTLLRARGVDYLVTLETQGDTLSAYGYVPTGQMVLLERRPVTASLPSRLIAGDLNGDQLEDIALIATGSSEVLIGVQTPDASGILLTRLDVGPSPSDIALVDIDGRNGLDLVVIDQFSGDGRVLFNDAVAPFVEQVRYRVGTGLYGLADVAGNTVLYSRTMPVALGVGQSDSFASDLFVVNAGDNTLTVLRNAHIAGTGLFDPQPSGSLRTGQRPGAVVTGLFNDDVYLDVAVLNEGSADLSVFLADGEGGYAEKTVYGPNGQKVRPLAGNRPAGLAAHDVNKDGRLDLLVGNELGDLLVLLGSGDGTFEPYQRADRHVSLALLASDSPNQRASFVFANQSMDRLTMQSSQGETFQQGRQDGILNPNAVRTADLNADGLTDLIVANGGGNGVLVYLGQGVGRLGVAQRFFAGTNPVGITVSDLNLDGNLDLVVANQGSNDLSVLLGRQRGLDWTLTPGPRLDAGSGPVATAVRDVSGDGIPDILVVNNASNEVRLLVGVGNGFFRDSADTWSTGVDPKNLFVGDFDANPGLDLVTVNAGSNDLTFFSNFGPGRQVRVLGQAISPLIAGVTGDFDNNGLNDLIVASRDGRFALLLGGAEGLALSQVLDSSLTNISDLVFHDLSDRQVMFYVSMDGREEAIPLAFRFAQEQGDSQPEDGSQTQDGWFSSGLTPDSVTPLAQIDAAGSQKPTTQFTPTSSSVIETVATLTFGLADEDFQADAPADGSGSSIYVTDSGGADEEQLEVETSIEERESAGDLGTEMNAKIYETEDWANLLGPLEDEEDATIPFPSPLEAFVPWPFSPAQNQLPNSIEPEIELHSNDLSTEMDSTNESAGFRPEQQWTTAPGWDQLSLALCVSALLFLGQPIDFATSGNPRKRTIHAPTAK